MSRASHNLRVAHNRNARKRNRAKAVKVNFITLTVTTAVTIGSCIATEVFNLPVYII